MPQQYNAVTLNVTFFARPVSDADKKLFNTNCDWEVVDANGLRQAFADTQQGAIDIAHKTCEEIASEAGFYGDDYEIEHGLKLLF